MPHLEGRNFIILLALIVFLTKLPTAALDYHMDELVVAGQAKYYQEHGPFVLPPGIVLHVPLIPWLLALLYFLIGETPLLTHIVAICFGLAGAMFTYLIGRSLWGEKVGQVASLLLFLSPPYFALSGQMLYDVPLAATVMAAVYFAMQNRFRFYVVAAAMAVMTKEPGVIAVAAITAWKLLRERNVRALMWCLPALLLVPWYVWYSANASLIPQPFPLLADGSPVYVAERFATAFYQTAVWNYGWLLLLAVSTFAFMRRDALRKKVPDGVLPLLIVGGFLFVAFSVTGFYLPRYVMPLYPLFFLFGAGALHGLFPRRYAVPAVVIALLFISAYAGNTGLKAVVQDPVFHTDLFYGRTLASIRSGELSMDYVEIVKAQDAAKRYVLAKPGSVVAAAFPFVERASLAANVGGRQWKANDMTVLYPLAKETIDLADVIVVEPYGEWPAELVDYVSAARRPGFSYSGWNWNVSVYT